MAAPSSCPTHPCPGNQAVAGFSISSFLAQHKRFDNNMTHKLSGTSQGASCYPTLQNETCAPQL